MDGGIDVRPTPARVVEAGADDPGAGSAHVRAAGRSPSAPSGTCVRPPALASSRNEHGALPPSSTVRVRYAETDKMGVVYYANYFVWFEVARADLLRALGWSYREMEQPGVWLPVIEAHCEYRRPARYDDEMEVRTEGRVLSPVRMEFTYEVRHVRRRRRRRVGHGPSTPRSTRRPAVPAAGSHPEVFA